MSNERGPGRPPKRGPGGEDDQGVSSMMRSVVAWLVLIAGAMVILLLVDRGAPQAVPVGYVEFQRLLDNGAIKRATVLKSQREDYEFRGELTEEMEVRVEGSRGETRKTLYITTLVPAVDQETLAIWQEKIAEDFSVERSSELWGVLITFLPWVLIIALMVFFFRRMQGGASRGIFSFGKSRAKMLSETAPRVTFTDVAGAEEAKEELFEVVEFLRDPSKFQRLGAKIPRGVLLLGPPGTGKCVTGETLVLTNKGMMEIRDVPTYYYVDPENDRVHGAQMPTVDPDSMSDRTVPASHWYDLGAQETIRLSTAQGASIEGTPEHPIVVLDDAGNLEFRELRDIRLDDRVAVKYGSHVYGTLDVVDPEQAYLMGLITGDGNMSISNRVELTSADNEISEFFETHMRGRYGSDLNIGQRQDGLTQVVSSWRVKKDLFDAGLSSLLSYDKKIPATILQAPKRVIVAFLQGLFDADGYFDRYMFGYSTASRDLARQVGAILLNMGIVPRTRLKREPTEENPHAIWEVTVSGTSLPPFAEQIGFRLERKAAQLREYLGRPNVCTNTNVDLFDGGVVDMVLDCWTELSRLRKSTSRLAAMADKVRTRRRVSRNALQEFVEAFERAGLEDPTVDHLRSLLSLNLFFTPVTAIGSGFANVYDFTVPEVHSFISNGMISHNTLLARAVAGEAGVQFLTISGADFVEMFVGVGASRVRDLFEQAKKVAPAIVFIDEIDAVGRQRGAGLGGGHDEREQTLNALLVEMDGFEANTGVIIIAATNRPDVLDPALLRPGRFDRQVTVDLPDRRGREGILQVHARKLPLAENVDLEAIAKSTPGFSGADLANLCNEAAIFAARRNGERVTMYDFETAKDKLMLGLERRSMIMSEDEKKMTAYHEVGHVLVGWFVPEGDPLHKVTVIPRGRALGVTHFLPNDDSHTRSREWFEAKIAMALGGRAAELIVFGNLTSGAQGDIKTVTQMARMMVCQLGMSEKLGPIDYSQTDGEVFLGRDLTTHRDISESTAELIDSEIRGIVDAGMELAVSTLREHEELLHRMSKLLIERETLDAEEIAAIIRGEELPPLEVKKMLEARLASEGSTAIESDAEADLEASGPSADGTTTAIGGEGNSEEKAG